jgi:hypothetical protein
MRRVARFMMPTEARRHISRRGLLLVAGWTAGIVVVALSATAFLMLTATARHERIANEFSKAGFAVRTEVRAPSGLVRLSRSVGLDGVLEKTCWRITGVSTTDPSRWTDKQFEQLQAIGLPLDRFVIVQTGPGEGKGEATMLDFSKTSITARTLQRYADHDVRSLDWSNAMPTLIDLRALEQWHNLARLDLADLPITDADLAHLSPKVQLHYLDLSGTQVTGASLAQLGQQDRLRSLHLRGVVLSDTDVSLLRNCPRLINLSFAADRLTDEGAVALLGCPWLTTLELQRPDLLSLEALQTLVEHRSLNDLTIHSERWTVEQLRRLKRRANSQPTMTLVREGSMQLVKDAEPVRGTRPVW